MAIEIASISVIFGVARSSKAIAEMLGVIESVDSKINTLMQSKLGAALRSMEQARDTSSEKQREPLLQDARRFFNEALSLEKNERLIATHLGLAFCHFALGDRNNGLSILKATEKIEFSLPVQSVAKDVAKLVLLNPLSLIGLSLLGRTIVDPDFRLPSSISMEKSKFYYLKKAVMELHETLLYQKRLT